MLFFTNTCNLACNRIVMSTIGKGAVYTTTDPERFVSHLFLFDQLKLPSNFVHF